MSGEPDSRDKALKRTGDPLADLVELMARLRAPVGGCPWDIEQTFETIAPYTIEEAYEVADAIERGALPDLKKELGDLLFQVLFHSRIAEELGAFRFRDVAEALIGKMLDRHPHVFSTAEIADADAQTRAWEAMKARERQAAAQDGKGTPSALAGVARALPALLRAEKLQRRAARVGFDWPHAEDVMAKLHEEVGELERAIRSSPMSIHDVREELGDVLFVVANLARKLEIDPEAALQEGNRKFVRRFEAMERLAADDGVTFADLTLDQQEDLWRRVKLSEGLARDG